MDEDIVAVPRRRWGQLVAAIVVIAGVLALLWVFVTSPNVQWNEVLKYLTYGTILRGAALTVELTFFAMIGGTIVGLISALMGLSSNGVLRTVSQAYVWLFRGTPLLVQIIFWFNLALFIPRIGFGQFSVSTNDVMTSFVAALIALSLNSGAYLSEIIRGGILSVDEGQTEAALALGMSYGSTIRHIVLPQSLRVIVPSAGNQLIGLLKDTSLVSVIAAQELLTQAQVIYNRNYLVIELLIVASVWYLVMTTIATLLQRLLERRLAVSTRAGATRRRMPVADERSAA